MANDTASPKTMHILVTLDEKYLPPFRVLAKSITVNNRDYRINFVLAHSSISPNRLQEIEAYCDGLGAQLTPITIDANKFEGAPITKRYPIAVYYRLLVPHLLPPEIERVVYLDCDTLVINSLAPLWEMDLHGMAYAAASHSGKSEPGHARRP